MIKPFTIKVKQTEPAAIGIRSGFIRLDALLKLANAVESGGQAKVAIAEGRVKVNGEACVQRGRKLYPGDVVRFAGEKYVVTEEDKNNEV